jgi:peroxiredoxin Q/BCP
MSTDNALPISSTISALPDLVVASTQGSFNLKDLNHKFTVIYFYPKDSTSGCSVQARDFRDLQTDFENLGAKIYGVSRDSMKSHDKFTTNESIPFPLISDPDETLCRLFDVIKQKNMYGKIVQGIERSTFLFNEKGELIQSWRKVKAESHAEFLLKYLKELT